MSLTEQNYQSHQTGLQFNSLFEHTGSVRELYISLHFIQNTDTDEHSHSHPLTGAGHIRSCTVAINMYVGMHALGSDAARIRHLAVRPNEQRWRGNEDSARFLQTSQKETNNSLQTISHAGPWEGGWGDGRHRGEIVLERS